jgi:membrane-bound serine protease (ClpP class)
MFRSDGRIGQNLAIVSMLVLGCIPAVVSRQPTMAMQQEDAPAPSSDSFVVVCPIDTDIMDGIAVVVERAVTREAVGATAVVFVVDTFGGRVDSAIEIAQTIMECPVPTIAYITGRGAISAGALISYACDYIVMAPGASIGASMPIVPGVEVSEDMNEKSMSFLRAKYRALGEENGHNPLIGEAMVDASIELYGYKAPDATYTVYKVENGRIAETQSTKPQYGRVSVGLPDMLLQGNIEDKSVEEALRGVQETIRDVVETIPKSDSGDTFPLVRNPDTIPGLPAEARVISPAGKLLTLTTREAQEVGLITYTADSPEHALNFLGFHSFRTVPIEETWAEILFAFLTSPLISGLLLLCGVGGLYVEFKTPGLGLPGFIGVACLALFFGSRLVIGIADWIDVLLVVTGLILLLAEIFVIPGFGLAGVSGILCVLAGVYLSLTRVTFPEYTWDFMRLRDAGVTLMVACLVFTVFLVLTWKLFPKTRMARALILADAQVAAAGYVVQTQADMIAAVGRRGTATSMLRPAGRGRFGKDTYDLMTRGEFIENGRPIEIIQAEGNRYVVKEIEE